MELVVISGKGGTGKTTVVAALSEFAEKKIKVDCDVDASNLYLLYPGNDLEKKYFYGGKAAKINASLCRKCEICEEVCKFEAIKDWKIDPLACEGCGACTLLCPQNAIHLVEEKTADTFITKTDTGILSRARMESGSDGSGKLVTLLRKNAKRFEDDHTLTLVDGSPGIGCSVIASITGADAVLIVTEPTKSGLLDLKRIVELAQRFTGKIMVCINKYDINPQMGEEIEQYIRQKGLFLVGKIPFDETVMKAINQKLPITDFKDSKAKKAIEDMWNIIKPAILNKENMEEKK